MWCRLARWSRSFANMYIWWGGVASGANNVFPCFTFLPIILQLHKYFTRDQDNYKTTPLISHFAQQRLCFSPPSSHHVLTTVVFSIFKWVADPPNVRGAQGTRHPHLGAFMIQPVLAL